MPTPGLIATWNLGTNRHIYTAGGKSQALSGLVILTLLFTLYGRGLDWSDDVDPILKP
jgi:hypothetical protein